MIRNPLFLLVAAVALFVLAPAPALAGHYELVDCPEITTHEENEKLAKAGIETTEQLLAAVTTAKARRKLRKKTRIAKKRLLWWADFCDLLRIDGVGPIMVRLLQATGIPNVAALAKETPEGLIPRVSATNKKYGITDPPPTIEHLKSWISQARALPIIVK